VPRTQPGTALWMMPLQVMMIVTSRACLWEVSGGVAWAVYNDVIGVERGIHKSGNNHDWTELSNVCAAAQAGTGRLPGRGVPKTLKLPPIY
jgi:hypothetical protein